LPRRPRIAVVGSINIDLVARCERLPERGETVTDAEFARVPGGKGANQAVAAARLGALVQIHGLVGRDEFGAELVSALEAARVDAGAVGVVDAPTGVALILVDTEGENEIVVAPGANAAFTADMLALEEHDAVLCQLEIPSETATAAANAATGFFCLNAAPAKPVPVEVLRRADLVVVNRYELEALAEAPRLTALTLGAEGAALLEAGAEVARARPPEVEAVDGTAAGDAFTACLLVSLLEGREREEALRRACAAGALAASRPGAQPSLPTAAEVDEILSG
jgi:ribokinase